MKQTILTNIQKGINLSELSILTGKTERQLGNILRLLYNDGYQFNKTVSDTGDIKLDLNCDLKDKLKRINYTSNQVRVGVIADIHIGRDDDGADNLKQAIEYFKANDIHIVFVIGDILEGVTYFESSKYPDGDTQLERFFKVFPYNPKLVFFYIKGNHDYSFLKYNGLDIGKRILNRPDFIDLGFGYGRIQLGKSVIGLKHDLLLSKPMNYADDDIVIKGHSHRFEFLNDVIVAPAILGDNFYEDTLGTGFLDITFNMSDDYIREMNIKQLLFYNGIKVGNDIKTPVKIKKKI